MKVLFLDIDGVLNSTRTAVAFGGYPHDFTPDLAQFDLVAVAMIQGLVQVAKLRVVLSSAWRITHTVHEVADALGLPIIDKTPRLCGTRGEEIADWLAKHPEVERYAIVDDDNDMLPEQQDRLVHTNGHEGLSFANYTRLAELFGVNVYDCAPARVRQPAPKLAWEA